jgi:hypothetical protein
VLKIILTTKIAQISIHVKNRGLIAGAHGNDFSVLNLWGIFRAKMNNQPAKINEVNVLSLFLIRSSL